MVSFSRCSLYLAVASTANLANGQMLRKSLPRNNIPDSSVFGDLSFLPIVTTDAQVNGDEAQDELDAMEEVFAALAATTDASMSMSLTAAPSDQPSDSPTNVPTFAPPTTEAPSAAPFTNAPTNAPTGAPTDAPTSAPIPGPITLTASPVVGNDVTFEIPTPVPSSQLCPGITAEERVAQILAILDAVADPAEIRDNSTPQGLATTWLLSQDEFQICPDAEKLVQRWVLAVIYFSTQGDNWFACSGNPSATDNCGRQRPFRRKERFLSGGTECNWAGIVCDAVTGCVTEIEFEENNLIGTVPSEIGLLEDLTVWGMERGNLTSTIPTEIGRLTNLVFIDLDFNELTGTLTDELLSLSNLNQLDLNNNKLSGSINGIGVFPDMEFLQLHDNFFTGTVPEGVGTFTGMTAFTLHESSISGTMPQSVCDLVVSAGNGGVLTSLIADCSTTNPNIVCDCCTDCRAPQQP